MQSTQSTGLGDDEKRVGSSRRTDLTGLIPYPPDAEPPWMARNEPLVTSPKVAAAMLNIGPTKLYELINNGELESYLDGSSRKITTASIRKRVARLLAQQA